MDIANEFYVDLVLASAIRLIRFNGSTTTLDIKNELRLRHEIISTSNLTFKPNFTQPIVSDAMIILEGLNFFTYTDNGTYRTYKLNTVDFANEQENNSISPVSLSLQEALETINDLVKDNDITITFTKLDGDIRTIKGTVYSPNIGLGHMLVYDNELPDGIDGNNIRSVDLRRLISFELDDIVYVIDRTIK